MTARDRGTPPNAHTLTISLRVADENDNSPIFDPKQYSASDNSSGFSLGQASVSFPGSSCSQASGFSSSHCGCLTRSSPSQVVLKEVG